MLINKLTKQVEFLMTKIGAITQQNNIILKSFGDENMSYLSDTFYKALIDSGPYASIPRLVKKIHFNERHPENMNIKVIDKSEPYIVVYEDNAWIIKNRKEVIVDIIHSKFNLIDSKYNEVKEGFDDSKKEIYDMYKETVRYRKEIDMIIEDVEQVLMDNS